MAELVRILTALLALFLQLFGLEPMQPMFRQPSSTAPAATATSVPDTATPTWTPTATPTLPPPTVTPSVTPQPSATPSATVAPTHTATATHVPDPTAPPRREDPLGVQVTGEPPAQKLPAAMLVYPLVRNGPMEETRIQMVNVTSSMVTVKCLYVQSVRADFCRSTNFFLTLTPNQPVAWAMSSGSDGNGTRIAPPLVGEGELKCFVQPRGTDLGAHNAIQGRALVSDSEGQTIGYNAIAFRRLTPGSFSGTVRLDGVTYEQCPDRLHFHSLMSQAGSNSELVLVPCTEDLLAGTSSQTTVQFAVINEFEQQSSGSTNVGCFSRRSFSSIPALRKSTVGTDSAHVIVRGVEMPVVGLVIERFTVPGSGAPSVSSNAPYLEGGRSANVFLP